MKMNLEAIVSEVRKRLSENIKVYDDSSGWNFYNSIYGFHEGKYVNLYFMETLEGVQTLEIERHTENVDFFIEMIKEIDPNSTIIYTERIYKECIISSEERQGLQFETDALCYQCNEVVKEKGKSYCSDGCEYDSNLILKQD